MKHHAPQTALYFTKYCQKAACGDKSCIPQKTINIILIRNPRQYQTTKKYLSSANIVTFFKSYCYAVLSGNGIALLLTPAYTSQTMKKSSQFGNIQAASGLEAP